MSRAAAKNVELGAKVISNALKAAAPRPTPDDKPGKKLAYAVRFADKVAQLIAGDLKPRLKEIQATTKRAAGALHKNKQLDVNYSTLSLGLGLGISLKSVHIREKGGRYTHNMKRNEEELRIEASGYHKRQPYAVMVGVLFLPFDSCDDGKKDNPSSFGSWVRHLRPYAGRVETGNDYDKFEKIYVALYEPNGADLRFFDVESDPPKNKRPSKDGDLGNEKGHPRQLLSYEEFLDQIYHEFLRRNSADFRWLDGEEEPLAVEPTVLPDDES